MYRDAQFSERFKRQGLEPSTGTPEQFDAFIKNEVSTWTKVFKEVGISLK